MYMLEGITQVILSPLGVIAVLGMGGAVIFVKEATKTKS